MNLEEHEKASTDTGNQSEESVENMEALINQLTLDATVDTSSDRAAFHFSLTNQGDKPVILGFNSSQQYEIKVENSNGESVYTYSADKMFTQQLTTEELASQESLKNSETWEAIKTPGNYTVTITYLVSSINDQPLDAEPFQATQRFIIEDQKPEDPEANQAFKDIKVSGNNGNYTVTGKAKVFEGSFMYTVEDGHHVQIEPTAVQAEAGAPQWGHSG
ncbi:BsuPI-related putative proteinase inhibitor [Halobacillus salinarum]|uniref:Intracellular proteinase inhibitor BsuPI domain-containing protein n=1 Tax=Halobacillus salinarum TaxID=2932257 RepID=A0ABY4EG63_9BACI|nr:BsuPI-related putative proteinase inhibitor [Halobacillus salinarum]UOQ43464.1 BsuPI-related putative proteinase inhibitor [Halobacillus salinarum]